MAQSATALFFLGAPPRAFAAVTGVFLIIPDHDACVIALPGETLRFPAALSGEAG